MIVRPKHAVPMDEWGAAMRAAVEGREHRGHGPVEAQVVYHTPGGEFAGFLLQCVATDPPSARGRTVDVWLEGDDIADVLLALRATAIEQRRASMQEASP